MLFLAELRQRYAPKRTQGEVARVIGVARQRVSEWERGATTPSVEQLLRLALMYDVPLELLFDPRWFREQREHMLAVLVECGFSRRHEIEHAGSPQPHA